MDIMEEGKNLCNKNSPEQDNNQQGWSSKGFRFQKYQQLSMYHAGVFCTMLRAHSLGALTYIRMVAFVRSASKKHEL